MTASDDADEKVAEFVNGHHRSIVGARDFDAMPRLGGEVQRLLEAKFHGVIGADIGLPAKLPHGEEFTAELRELDAKPILVKARQ